MTKNLIPEIAKMLGVEIGEEFKIKDNHSGNEIKYLFRFTNERLERYAYNAEKWEHAGYPTLFYLIVGAYEINLKLPWKPEYGETYWTYTNKCWLILSVDWIGWTSDFIRLKSGCVFRTKEEAIEARPRIYKELTGKEWQDE